MAPARALALAIEGSDRFDTLRYDTADDGLYNACHVTELPVDVYAVNILAMITVSTSNMEQRAYHHGDLRSALVAAGLRAVESTDIADISLRGLAREVGVSATAVYRHFPDKRALLEAMAQEGLAQLGQLQQQAALMAGGQAFSATGAAYVRFALANPGLFRLVFTHCEVRTGGFPEGNLAAAMLLENADRIAGGDQEAARRIAVQAWALVHGLAMLMLDGQLPADEALIDRVMDGRSMWQARS